jgi:hypothetical protein
VLLFACTHFGRFTPMLRRTPRAVSHARLNGFEFADPSRLRLEEPCPDVNRPLTSHVIATARALRLQPKSSLATRSVLRRPECFTAATRSVRYPSGKGRPVTTPRRLLPYRARCLATPLKPECGFDPANRASRVRSPRPLSSPLIAGVSDSSVARSSPERRSRMACGHASRRSQQVIDQRCVRSAICQRHFDYGHPRSRSVVCRRCPLSRSSCESHWRGPADAWRVSRRPTHFGCVGL